MDVPIMNKSAKLVHGVGLNDADYQIASYAIICGRRKQQWVCPIYIVWKGMLERCYSAKYQLRCPTYIGCSVVQEWHSFSAFRAWMLSQDHKGRQLDKDILVPGNRVYGPGTCVFVSPELNKLLNGYSAARGEWPIGVCLHKGTGKFQAMCCNPFNRKNEHLGLFTTPDAANDAWRVRKHEHACTYAELQSDPRVATALRARYAS